MTSEPGGRSSRGGGGAVGVPFGGREGVRPGEQREGERPPSPPPAGSPDPPGAQRRGAAAGGRGGRVGGAGGGRAVLSPAPAAPYAPSRLVAPAARRNSAQQVGRRGPAPYPPYPPGVGHGDTPSPLFR